ncbi:MAG TPA: DUF3667 domain-containing protein [Chryseolinea sp.]|jgi:hypothetical protein|nr:DUF3667 domain-containing protein [Chryseolinea sp.]
MADLDEFLAAAEGMVNAEQGAKVESGSEKRHCLNCSTPLTDVYCPHCGQKDIPSRQTLGELVFNFISSFSGYESKFFTTCRYLLFKPGFLATEYNVGRRERYFHPARMYVFISFIFFLLFFSLPDDEDSNTNLNITTPKEDLKDLREELHEAGLDSIYGSVADSLLLDSLKSSQFLKQFTNGKNSGGFRLSTTDYKSIEAYDSSQQAKPESERDGWLERRLQYRNIKLNQKYRDKGDEFASDFKQAFMDHFSQTLFFLLPFFALLLKLLYIRRNYYYSEHLVLSICYYNFFYLAASLVMLINLIPGVGFISVIIAFWIYLYFLFAMKRMYNQSWPKTVLKFVMFSLIFAFLILIGVSVNAMVTLMLI